MTYSNHKEFTNVLNRETHGLKAYIEKWEKILENMELSEEITGDINVAIGQAELIIRQRFLQFSKLIKSSEEKSAEKDITIEDLQGFWDIVNIQVDKIKLSFIRLEKLRENNWQPPIKSQLPEIRRKKLIKPAAFSCKVASKNNIKSSIRQHILAFKKKESKDVQKTESKENDPGALIVLTPPLKRSVPLVQSNQGQLEDENEGIKEFEGGFFKVLTPIRQNTPKRKITDSDTDKDESSPFERSSKWKKTKCLGAAEHRLKDHSPCMRVTRAMKTSNIANCPAPPLHF